MAAKNIYRLPVDQIMDIIVFLPEDTCAKIIAGTELRNIKKHLNSLEHLTLSKISQDKILPVGTLVYQGSRSDNIWNVSHNIGWYTTGTPTQLNYAGACPEERGYVHQFRTKREIRVAVHNQMLNFIFFTSNLIIEWDICKKYDGLFVDNGSEEINELAVCNPNEYLEYTQSLRCADHQNFIVGGIKLNENLPVQSSVAPYPSIVSRNPSRKLRLVPQNKESESVGTVISRAASSAVSRSSSAASGAASDRVGPVSVVAVDSTDVKDPWGAFDGPEGGVLYFTVVLDENATNDIGQWCLDKIAQEGNWKAKKIFVSTEEERKKYLKEANDIRSKKSVNPNIPLPCDRYTLPVVFWDNYFEETLINRKVVGGYTELVEFLNYINKVQSA